MILSVPALGFSFDTPDDGYHVGIHEFAHLLDVEQTRFDGIPSWLTDGQIREWEPLRDEEMRRARTGDSILDSYGAYDPVEFLAVALENFFERPVALRQSHGRLYELLAKLSSAGSGGVGSRAALSPVMPMLSADSFESEA